MQQDAIKMQHGTTGAPARLDFQYQPRRYSSSAFEAREASRVVFAVGGTVRVIQHHAGLDKIYYVISKLENKYAAEVDDVIINPHPQAVTTG